MHANEDEDTFLKEVQCICITGRNSTDVAVLVHAMVSDFVQVWLLMCMYSGAS